MTDRNFFQLLLPRVAMADDAMWYALCAASTLIEHPVSKNRRPMSFVEDDLTRGWHRQALEWYGRSLKAAKELPTSTNTVLRTFVYGALEMLQDRPDVGLKLIHQALLLNEASNATSDGDWEVLNATLPMLTRALVPLSMFGLPVTRQQRQRARRPRCLKQSSSTEATTLDRMEELHDLIYEIQIFCNSRTPTDTPDSDDLAHQQALIESATAWRDAIPQFDTLTQTGTPRRFLAQLLVLYEVHLIKLSTIFQPTLTIFDAYEPHFQTIVSEATRVLSIIELNDNLFAWEIAAVPCLYYTAWACRRPRLRRRAIELIRDHGPRQENLWTAESCLTVMEQVVAYEEGRAAYAPTVSDEENQRLPPPHRRLPMAAAGDPLNMYPGAQRGGGAAAAAVTDGPPARRQWEQQHNFWNVAKLFMDDDDKRGGLSSGGAFDAASAADLLAYGGAPFSGVEV